MKIKTGNGSARRTSIEINGNPLWATTYGCVFFRLNLFDFEPVGGWLPSRGAWQASDERQVKDVDLAFKLRKAVEEVREVDRQEREEEEKKKAHKN